jgi:LPPG:FO 2-phospho-L-lactate transferase
VLTSDGWLDFQDYFVRRGHRDDVLEIRFDGLAEARPTLEVTAALHAADVIVIAPSNPFVSVAPILSLDGMLDIVRASTASTVAVSPIVGGAALRGPAAQMLRTLGTASTVIGIAKHYATRYPGVVDVLVIDEGDAAEQDAIAGYGMRAVVAPIIIPDAPRRAALARRIMALASD